MWMVVVGRCLKSKVTEDWDCIPWLLCESHSAVYTVWRKCCRFIAELGGRDSCRVHAHCLMHKNILQHMHSIYSAADRAWWMEILLFVTFRPTRSVTWEAACHFGVVHSSAITITKKIYSSTGWHDITWYHRGSWQSLRGGAEWANNVVFVLLCRSLLDN